LECFEIFREQSRRRVLANIARVMAPGGRVLIVDMVLPASHSLIARSKSWLQAV
jgi:ubiquinone/menaquinone biosynthesis C-methylase UbiE